MKLQLSHNCCCYVLCNKCGMIFHVLFDSFVLVFQISEKLKSMGLEGESKISWRKSEGGEVFHQERSRTASLNQKCTRR